MPDSVESSPDRRIPDAPPEIVARVTEVASRFGFTDVRVLDREAGMSPLVYARWRGAPVALSLRSGLAGGFSVAFYRGPQPEQVDEDGYVWTDSEWDEVIDTSFGSPELAVVLGAAALEAYADGRENLYRNVSTESTDRFLSSDASN